MRYFLVVFLFSSWAMASEIVFDRTTNLGARQRDVLRFEKGRYYFDGKDLGTKLSPAALNAWKAIEKGPSARKPASCFAGTYSYTNSLSKKKITRRGCTYGPEFGGLMQNLEDLRNYARGL
ncbi:hypothetical protein [Bdellovibrio bacteriovorus]|uniref:hypothetical protein n=1 Tax=Bdellovibrio bacteriovorus TaxID=959 RepID=UPI0035A71D9C